MLKKSCGMHFGKLLVSAWPISINNFHSIFKHIKDLVRKKKTFNFIFSCKTTLYIGVQRQYIHQINGESKSYTAFGY